MCFGDKMIYSITETDTMLDENIPAFQIGEFSPPIYQKLCPEFKIAYQLLNGSQFIEVQRNELKTLANVPLDFDSHNPGQVLVAAVNCTVRNEALKNTTTISRDIRVHILDKNDNFPELHNGAFSYNLEDPHFTKVGIIV